MIAARSYPAWSRPLDCMDSRVPRLLRSALMKMIVVDTVRQHLENGLRLHARCVCGRADWLDLQRLVELGHGELHASQIGGRLRCRACGRKSLEVQRHGPPLPSEELRERERIAAERREKVTPFRSPRGK